MAQRLREYGGDLKLCGLDPVVIRMLDYAGISNYFDKCASVDAAMACFGGTSDVKEG